MFAALALVLLAPLGIWLAIVMLRVETTDGTLIVEMNDDEVEARIKNGKLILSGPDGSRYTLTPNERRKDLKTGSYTIRVEGADGLVLDTPKFTLKKGGEVKVRVTLGRNDVPKMADVITNSIGMKLVRIAAGMFKMGSPKGEGSSDEEPQHEVEITKPFYMGAYTVTQAEYKEVMGENPSYFSASGGGKDKVIGMNTSKFPVETVSWEDATKFCEKVNAMEKEKEAKREYRLPTEAEWECACRAGTTTKYHSGDDEDDLKRVGWYDANSDGWPHEVGAKKANAWGLYDMHGNVWQWCADWYDSDYYGKSHVRDPECLIGTRRVLRGGSWVDNAGYCRAAFRSFIAPGDRDYFIGFRVVCVPARTR